MRSIDSVRPITRVEYRKKAFDLLRLFFFEARLKSQPKKIPVRADMTDLWAKRNRCAWVPHNQALYEQIEVECVK